MSDENTRNYTTKLGYKPVPSGYDGWACPNGVCLCDPGDEKDILPSSVECVHGVLSPSIDPQR